MKASELLVTPEQLRKELARPEGAPRLVDVREPEEWEMSRLEGATLIPLGEVMQRARTELPDLDADLVIYCAHGVRSMHAMFALQRMGFRRVRSLHGGLCEWETSART